jgi:hypothetical protein
MRSDAFAAALLKPSSQTPEGIKGLIRAMEANFPAVRRLLGEVYFAGLAREYVLRNPPQSTLMFEYGGEFSAYLRAQADLEKYPYLADVAILEGLMRQSYHSADDPVLGPEVLATISTDKLGELCFKPHSALRLLSSSFAVVSVIQASVGNESTAPDPGRTEWAVVTRPEFEVVVTSVTGAQFTFIQNLADGQCLLAAADAASGAVSELDLASTLSLALRCGMFSTILQIKSGPST